MFRPHVAAVLGLALLAAQPVLADPANHVVTQFGSVTVPFTHSFGNTFTGTQASGFRHQDGSAVTLASIGGQNYFYDDYVFTLPLAERATFNAAAITIDLGGFLSLQNFSARLYKLDAGLASLTTGSVSGAALLQAWTSQPLALAGLSGASVLFEDLPLQAGASYALEVRGSIGGSFGGSYGGNLNITPIPEPTTAVLMLVSLGVIGAAGRRRPQV